MNPRRSHSPGRVPFAVLLLAVLGSTALAAPPARHETPAPGARWAVGDTLDTAFVFIGRIDVSRPPCDGCLSQPCPSEPVQVTVSGAFPNGCYQFRGLRELPVAGPFTVLVADIFSGACDGCPDVMTQFTGGIQLPPPLTPGPHSFQLVEQVRSCRDTTLLESSQSRMIGYEVAPVCETPIPIDSLARTLVAFGVAPEHRCAGDSLSLRMFKNGCPPCVHLTSLALEPGAGFHATLDWRPHCLEFACLPETLSTPLGAFAAGHHTLDGQVDVDVLTDTAADSIITYHTRVAFDVPPACDTTVTPCMTPFLLAGALRQPDCALTLDPGGRGTLTLSAAPITPLGGLQGRIECSAPFRVLHVRASAASHGLHVTPSPAGRGVEYIVFADPGSPIPAAPTPVLDVDLGADFGAVAGSRGRLLPLITLAADVNGDSVRLCPGRPVILSLGIPLCITGNAANCDANGDGRLDVRDLVQLLGCLRTLGGADSTGDSTGTRRCTDCNGDSLFNIADIFCCAHAILHGQLIARDSLHASDDVHVVLQTIAADARSALIRVHVTGVRDLGALRLRLDYPADRWRAESGAPRPLSTTGAAAGEWLQLVETEDGGHVQLGGLNQGAATDDELVFDVEFIATGTPQPGDQVEVVGADLAAVDGRVLSPKGTLPSYAFGTPPPTDIALSAAKPNPFTSLTRFTVALPRPAEIDLAVHDVAGRRVATLARGAFAAGQRSFSWDGAGARGGLYFVRLTVEGRVLSSRVVLLGSAN